MLHHVTMIFPPTDMVLRFDLRCQKIKYTFSPLQFVAVPTNEDTAYEVPFRTLNETFSHVFGSLHMTSSCEGTENLILLRELSYTPGAWIMTSVDARYLTVPCLTMVYGGGFVLNIDGHKCFARDEIRPACPQYIKNSTARLRRVLVIHINVVYQICDARCKRASTF